MAVNTTVDIKNLRGLSKLVSHAAFKKLSAGTNQSAYIRRMKKYLGWEQMGEGRPRTLEALIAAAYQTLCSHYRHEYIYKSRLLTDFVLKHYALEDTVLLNEFRIGSSIADAVLINGTNKVFEIKTELDTPERLTTQLLDYCKAFSEVYVFTHHTLAAKYFELLPSNVGLLVYGGDGTINEERKAISTTQYLDIRTMMGSLRKPEYLKLVKTLAGFIPEATPVFLYKACLETLQCFTPEEVQRAYHSVLKERISVANNKFIEEAVFPCYLNFSIYNQKLHKNSYLRLVNNLNKTV
ncbi:sce7726 family protein [Olivibacter jilunii]|uniref:sce7726 family protein n=1 Tax=Olivibacter jilunii TaxID=985016 RepID=UPI003F191250